MDLNWIHKAIQRNMLDGDKGGEILNKLKDISYKINGFIRAMRKAS